MTLLEVALAFVAAATAWLVWSNLRAREAANEAIRRVCSRHGYLFLDDTVALASMWPVRDDEGRITVRRVFGFDYSDTGHGRRSGTVTLVGASVSDVRLEAPSAASDTPH
jgi:hypothetical protein